MSDKPIIIIKKRGKKKPHEAHGGSWKIAYADFVTAMMAFFLLMWLINVTSVEQRKGIADYFSPNFISTQTQNGSAGVLGGVNFSNPNNSSGKSTQEREKNTEIEVDIADSKRQDELQDQKEASADSMNAAKKVKVDQVNAKGAKKDDSIKVVEKVTITAAQAKAAVDPLKEKQSPAAKPATKDEKMNLVINAVPSKADAKIDSSKTEAPKVDEKEVNKTIEKIVKVDLRETKIAKTQAAQKVVDEKALSQAAETAKNINAATTYERSIASAMSDKKAEQKKAMERDAAESKEKQEAIKKLQLAENERLKEVASAIKDLVQKNPELQGLLPHLIIENRPEGLRIQLIDKDNKSMFASGSSSMTLLTKQLLKTVASLIEKMPNGLVISGHTDAHPFVGTRKYSNWELSSDRANATRRTLEEFNVAAKRFESVMGKEATDPFVREDPFAESNRRISITLLREYGMPSDDMFRKMVGG